MVRSGGSRIRPITRIGTKKKGIQAKESLFGNYSNGAKTNRDAWCYNFSSSALEANIRSLIYFYNSEVARLQSEKTGNAKVAIDDFVNNDPKKISWTRALKADLYRGKQLEFDEGRIAPVMYRPFTRKWLYFSRRLNEVASQMLPIFPHAAADNQLICVTGVGARSFSVLMVDKIPDLNLLEAGAQCFPLYLYEKPNTDDSLFDQQSGATDSHGYTRRDAITDDALAKFRTAYGNTVSKRDIFHYIYGLLHVPSYRLRFANNLSKALPRIPLAADPDHFTALVDAGRELGDLHVGFDRVDPWPLEFANGGWDAPDRYRSGNLLPRPKDETSAAPKRHLTSRRSSTTATSPLPASPPTHGTTKSTARPALKWVMDRQAVSTDRDSGIVNDANHYATETIGEPSYPLKLLACVIRVSMETNRIVEGLPEPKWIE